MKRVQIAILLVVSLVAVSTVVSSISDDFAISIYGPMGKHAQRASKHISLEMMMLDQVETEEDLLDLHIKRIQNSSKEYVRVRVVMACERGDYPTIPTDKCSGLAPVLKDFGTNRVNEGYRGALEKLTESYTEHLKNISSEQD